MIQNFHNKQSEKYIYLCCYAAGLRVFKRSGTAVPVIPEIQDDYKADDETEREHKIICKFCNYSITSKDNVIEINGSHTHVCTNPAGATYTIGCFSKAGGCLSFGESTIEYTWFPGFIWNYAICSLCHNHLGWFYQSDSSSFYGLILDNLTENI